VTLVAVLANPALTSGDRTRARIAMASEILGAPSYQITNLFPAPSHSTLDIPMIGKDRQVWMSGRPHIVESLVGCTEVLLAYGTTAPSGEARVHFREQVEWLDSLLLAAGLTRWMVGDLPRHPTRWQRYTSRAYPHLSFPDALAASLVQR
jgi:hypothetical protein